MNTYKITYRADLMALQFVRVEDNAILFCSTSENAVISFADGFCAAKGISYTIE